MSKIIKRYSNRKLYDTERSTYITLDEVKEMVQAGEDIRIIDNTTKEDLTNVTLAQIIFEAEKSHKRLLPLSALRYIIQSGEDFVQRFQSPVHQFRDEFKKKTDVIEESGKAIFDATQRSLDEMQKRIDDRLRDTMDQLTHIPEMRREIEALTTRVEKLEDTVRRQQAQLSRNSSHPTKVHPLKDLP